jgi:RNA polymerase-binding transcription factor DksA
VYQGAVGPPAEWPDLKPVVVLTCIKELSAGSGHNGTNKGEDMMKHIESRRATLMKRLSELDSRLHRIEAELEQPHTQDWDDMAIEREGDEVLERLGQSGLDEIRRIMAALGRIRSGDYGFCAVCGAEISQERLDVLPATPFCKTCAAEH